MSAPDPKAVEAAVEEVENALLDERRVPAGILITLIDAACAYLRTPTAPQGAEPAYRPALAALMDYKQADEDGVMVLVSRQAIHEVFDALTWHDKHAAPQGAEPVAWLGEDKDGKIFTVFADSAARMQREGIKVTPLYAAPQGAEIAREPTERMVQAAMSAALAAGHDGDGFTYADTWRAMYDAALTPTDAETKHGS